MSKILMQLLSGVGAAVAVGILAFADQLSPGLVMLMAPFGASTVLVFGLPDSPLAQPKNVFFGHLLTALIGVVFAQYAGAEPLWLAVATGLGVTAMLMTGTTHPPAGANPLLIMMTGQSWNFLLTPVAIGAITIILVGAGFKKLIFSKYRLQ
ncbi:HPP family protein [Spongorhabdus nitratireducens]